MSGILPANQWFLVVFHGVVVQHGTFKKGLTPEDFAIKKPNQAARAKNGKYPECNSYLRMLAAFSLVMSFTGMTIFLVTGISGSQMPPVASCTVASLVARWRQ